MGKCPECSSFNSFAEEKASTARESSLSSRASSSRPLSRAERDQSTLGGQAPQSLSSVGAVRRERMLSGMPEFDRVLGGGLVPGSLVLIGGDPGIGKSTLLIEASVRLAAEYGSGIYLSGEESVEQIRLRADRLNLKSDNLLLASETDLLAIENHIQTHKPAFAVVDSIQTASHPNLDSAPGTLTQVREAATLLQRIAKEGGVPIFIVGHVNKEGNLAGPRALEHIVDTVLQLEGDEHGQFRILRAAKNRFGSTNELGVFEMTEDGMRSVDNPSQLFLSERQSNAPGSVVVATVEGARPLLVEVQALCSPSYFSSPRRTVTGADFNRVLVVLAVIEKRLGFRMGDMDVYVNVAGGLRVTEPAVDLGIALAVISSLRDVAVAGDACVFGEIGLAGEVRAVAHADRRATEASRLGFARCVLPQSGAERLRKIEGGVEIRGVSSLREAVEAILPQALERKKPQRSGENEEEELRPSNRTSRGRSSAGRDGAKTGAGRAQSTLGRERAPISGVQSTLSPPNGYAEEDFGPFGDE